MGTSALFVCSDLSGPYRNWQVREGNELYDTYRYNGGIAVRLQKANFEMGK